MTYLPCMQVLAAGAAFARLSAAKIYRHRMDSLSARWQRITGMMVRGLRQSGPLMYGAVGVISSDLFDALCSAFHRFGMSPIDADGPSLPTEKRFGLGRYPFRVRM